MNVYVFGFILKLEWMYEIEEMVDGKILYRMWEMFGGFVVGYVKSKYG